MISIAAMEKSAKPTKESRALTAAIKQARMTKAAVAEHLDVTPSLVSQWTSGYRPVSPEKAILLAKLLDVPPAAISASMRGIQLASSGGAEPEPMPEGEHHDQAQQIFTLQNDIHALNMALGALLAVMAVHRPPEASDLAGALRRQIPAKFRDRGLIRELLALLDKAPQTR